MVEIQKSEWAQESQWSLVEVMFFCRWKAVPRESLSVVCCRMLASNVILLPHIYRSRIKGTEEFCPQDPPPPYEAVQRQNSSEQVRPTGV